MHDQFKNSLSAKIISLEITYEYKDKKLKKTFKILAWNYFQEQKYIMYHIIMNLILKSKYETCL